MIFLNINFYSQKFAPYNSTFTLTLSFLLPLLLYYKHNLIFIKINNMQNYIKCHHEDESSTGSTNNKQ